MKKILLSSIGALVLSSALFANTQIELDRDSTIQNLSEAVAKLITEQEEMKKTILELGGKKVANAMGMELFIVTKTGKSEVKSEPSMESRIATTYNTGKSFIGRIVDTEYVYSNDSGYIKKRDVIKMSDLDIEEIVVNKNSHLRNTPNISDSKIVEIANKGRKLKIYKYAFNDGWYMTTDESFIFKPKD